MRPALHFSDTGTGSPTLIFVHGFGCAEDDWAAQVITLSPEFRCVTLDLPGYERSALPNDVGIATTVSHRSVGERTPPTPRP
jgi:pimeloyl-ACP methyl ester carboxylesterase